MTNSNRLVTLTVVENASQKYVIGKKDWVAIKNQLGYVTFEAPTSPRNNVDEWKQIVWSGEKSQPVPGKPNRRKLPLAVGKKHHVEAALGRVMDYLDL